MTTLLDLECLQLAVNEAYKGWVASGEITCTTDGLFDSPQYERLVKAKANYHNACVQYVEEQLASTRKQRQADTRESTT